MQIVAQQAVKIITQKRVFSKAICLADLVLGGGATISALVFCYFVYFYGWTGQRQFTGTMGALVYYALPTGLSGLLLASLRMRPAFKTTLAIVCLLFTATVYLAELSLAGANSAHIAAPFWGIDQVSPENKKVIAKLAERSGILFDIRDHVELIDQLRKRGIDAVPAVMLGKFLKDNGSVKFSDHTNGAELIPIGAIANRTTVLCNESGPHITYESDEHGFRNPQGIWKSAGADVAALGESFAQGYCVPNGNGFVDLFRKRYPVTLNLGMSGESSLVQLAAMKEYLPRYAPKIVLWFFCEGIDLYDLRDEVKHSLLMRYLEPNFSQHLFSRQIEIDQVLRRFIADTEMHALERKPASRYSAFVDKSLEIVKLANLRQKLGLVYGITNEDPEVFLRSEGATWDVFRDTLLQAKTLTNGWGGTLYFVYLPSWHRYGKDPRVPELERTRVLKVVGALGIPIVDIQTAFQAHNDPLSLFPIRKFGHYNEMGNQIVAERVLKAVSGRESIVH